VSLSVASHASAGQNNLRSRILRGRTISYRLDLDYSLTLKVISSETVSFWYKGFQ